jgi:hypothetical protein
MRLQMIIASQTMVALVMINVPLYMAKPFWRPFTNPWLKHLLDLLFFK